MLILSLVILLSSFRPSVSAPVADITKRPDGTTTGWKGDPDGRGTMTLLVSCLATLSLCVYSSIHLNLPAHNQPRFKYWLKFCKWLLTGIFAPELVVFAAWRQYSSARVLQQLIEGKMKSLAIKEEEERKKEQLERQDDIQDGIENARAPAKLAYVWTLMHGFYAGMGGFVIDPTPSKGKLPFIPKNYTRLTLTARGVKLLYECGHLPLIQKRDIKDKSKADSLAKSLVCLQAGWMCIQVLGRILSGLPVTLLEVNTLGHVFCALVVYVLWWHKPQLINEPTRLEGDWVRPLCAYMYMSSRISGEIARNPGMLKHAWKEPELAKLLYVDRHYSQDTDIQVAPEAANDGGNAQRQQMDHAPEHGESIVQILRTTTTESVSVDDNCLSKPPTFAFHRSFSEASTIAAYQSSQSNFVPMPEETAAGTQRKNDSEFLHSCDPNEEQLERWRLTTEAYKMFPAVRELFVDTGRRSKDGSRLLKFKGDKPEELIHEVSGNWPSDDLLRETQGLVMGSILWCASMVFGALHIAAWADYFPTEVECWMWRVCAIYITFSGGLWMLINLIAHFSKAIDAYWERVISFKASRLSNFILGFVCGCCGIAYIAARIFLVVEAFISIRKLPVTAYRTPEWSQIIPHL